VAQDALLDEGLAGGLASGPRELDGLLDLLASGEAEVDDDVADQPAAALLASRRVGPARIALADRLARGGWPTASLGGSPPPGRTSARPPRGTLLDLDGSATFC
jgi:hypothetical protein